MVYSVAMATSCVVSKIKRDIDRKTPIFIPASHLTCIRSLITPFPPKINTNFSRPYAIRVQRYCRKVKLPAQNDTVRPHGCTEPSVDQLASAILVLCRSVTIIQVFIILLGYPDAYRIHKWNIDFRRIFVSSRNYDHFMLSLTIPNGSRCGNEYNIQVIYGCWSSFVQYIMLFLKSLCVNDVCEVLP